MDGWRPARDTPYVAVSTAFLRSRKMRSLTPQQKLLYLAGLLHCGDELTDGFVSADVLPMLHVEAGSSPDDEAALVATGLWKRHVVRGGKGGGSRSDKGGDGGFDVPGFTAWNPPRQHVKAKHEQNAQRQQAWRNRHRNALRNGGSNGGSNALDNALVTTYRTKNLKPPLPPLMPPGGICEGCARPTGQGHEDDCELVAKARLEASRRG